MVKPPPISLRIRNSEATYRARKLLRELDEADLLQRRVKWQATKALVAIAEMNAVAAPKLQSMLHSDQRRWNVERRVLEQILKRIRDRGI